MNVNYAYIESLSIYIEFKYIFLKFYIESKMYTHKPTSMTEIL